MADQPKLCAICGNIANDDSLCATIYEKGCLAVNEVAQQRNEILTVRPGQTVHKQCRKQYTDKRSFNNAAKRCDTDWLTEFNTQKRTLRSGDEPFQFNHCCLFCASPVDVTNCHKRGDEWYHVRTKDFDESTKLCCEHRKDEWAAKVFTRICAVSDLHAVDALYHQTCSSNFRTHKGVPQKFQIDIEGDSKRRKCGRPEDTSKTIAFQKTMEYFEANDEEQLTVSQLVKKMEEFLDEEAGAYSVVYMKKKVLEHFNNDIVIACVDGKADVITHKAKASVILREFFESTEMANEEEQKFRMIRAVAKILQSEIKQMLASKDTYVINDDLSSVESENDYLPDTLRCLLDELFVGCNRNVKTASIGQCIVQAVRPRALICPLQLSLAVQMDHHFSSRFLLDTLYKLGFCSSYSEVQMFKRCAATSHDDGLGSISNNHVVQYVADNVDHDICTLDGRFTFHGMGMLAAVTPCLPSRRRCISRIKVNIDDILSIGKVAIHHYKNPTDTVLSQIRYEDVANVGGSNPYGDLDLLWLTSGCYPTPRPFWSGAMQTILVGEHSGRASIFYLPMIDMPATDETCIFSTIHFIASQAHRYNFDPVITFDQPLWWKAMKIVAGEGPSSQISRVTLKLGGFHLIMSYVGCIGTIMMSSGLKEVFELIYGANTVPHLMSGKAISRAIRAHIIVQSALFHILITSCDDQDQLIIGDLSPEESVHLKKMFDDCMKLKIVPPVMLSDAKLQRIRTFLDHKKTELNNRRTARLWLQYLEMVSLLQKFIAAERIGMWSIHLQAVTEMLPFLAASGHNLYTKSARLYLQMMDKLHDSHPIIHKAFNEGGHVIRRSDRFWGGLSADLVIEQEYMRSIKTSGGLTRGGGMTENERIIWVLSRPICLAVNLQMQNFTNIKYSTSDQHQEMGIARQTRDHNDCQIVIEYLKTKSPFEGDTQLRNIANGIVAGDKVNVDRTRDVGLKILESMTGKTLKDHSFKKKDQVILMTQKRAEASAMKTLDPSLLFQRIMTVAKRNNMQDDELFAYELCSYPSALFEDYDIPRKANKPELAKAIQKACDLQSDLEARPVEHVQYVIDGGALLHKIPWKVGSTFNQLFHQYSDYVLSKYHGGSVVFDGYQGGPSIKDVTHLRRNKVVGNEVQYTADMYLKTKKDVFLSSTSNKSRFLIDLAVHLRSKSISVIESPSDADVLIVRTALNIAKHNRTVVVADDTDILVLLIYHTTKKCMDVYFSPESKHGRPNIAWNIHNIQQRLSTEVCSILPFCHAILGCDSTSHLFGIGKGQALKAATESNKFREVALVFSNASATKEEIIEAGETAILHLYGGSGDIRLRQFRQQVFARKVATSSTFVHPQELPPTTAAASYHLLRVYFQVQIWQENSTLSPYEWGWTKRGSLLLPIMTDAKPAPPEIMKIIKCICKGGCHNCTCTKNGVQCTILCKNCKGLACSNKSPDSDNEHDVVEDD